MRGIDKMAEIKSAWEEWEIGEFLGEGSFGKVYEAVNKNHGVEMFSAIKVISIPQSPSELQELRAQGMNIEDSKKYLEDRLNIYLREIKTMINLKSSNNTVRIYNYKVIEKTNIIGWDIYIHMELLTNLDKYIADKRADKTLTEDLSCHDVGRRFFEVLLIFFKTSLNNVLPSSRLADHTS